MSDVLKVLHVDGWGSKRRRREDFGAYIGEKSLEPRDLKRMLFQIVKDRKDSDVLIAQICLYIVPLIFLKVTTR